MNIERAVLQAVEKLEELDSDPWWPAYRYRVIEIVKEAIEQTHDTKRSQPLSRYLKV